MPAALAAEPSASTQVVRIFVAANGDDRWTGVAPASQPPGNGPVQTLARAQALARAQLAGMTGGQTRRPIKVLIAPGTYPLTAPLTFTAADSGTAEAPVSYEALSPGTVTLSGGIALIPRSAATSGKPAVFDLPQAGRDNLRGGGQLFVNGLRATLARQPKAGTFWFVQRAVPLDSEPSGELGREAFAPDAKAARWIEQLSPAERSRAIVQVMHSWTSSQHRLSAAPAPAGALRLAPRSHWAFLSTGASQRYFVENVPSALDSGGEWVATESEVRYLPTQAQQGKSLEAVLPVLEHLVIIRGEPGVDKNVQFLNFRGLGFAHTRSLTPEAGFLDWQAAIEVGAAIEVDNAQHIGFDHCRFADTGGYGIWLRHSVRDSQVSNSEFTDLGAGGIQVGVAKEAKGESAPTSKITLDGNRVGNTGLLYPGAVGIWLAQGYDNIVTNNLIHDTSYTGVSVGWTWSLGPSASGRHRIADNLLVNIGQGQMSDMGGIYTLGNLPGTVISGNLIRDVHAYPGYGPGRGLGAWGIYNDLGSSGLVVENNVVLDTDSGAYHLNGGRDLLVRQNVFAGGSKAEIRVSRSTDGKPQATLQDNLLIAKVGQPLDGLAGTKELTLLDNQVSTAGGSAADLAKCGAGCVAKTMSVISGTDPKDIRFQGLDAVTAARVARVVLAAGPKEPAIPGSKSSVSAARAPVSAVAPPLPVSIDLQHSSIGSQPAGLSYQPAGDMQAIRVIADATAPGGRCLQFNDSPLFANRYDPHAYLRLNHETGAETVTFSILIDANTSFVHEWRDDELPYRVGPSLRLNAAGVTVTGKVVAPVVVGSWTRLRLSVPLGKPGGTWQLDVSDAAGKTVSVSGLRTVSPQWQDLNALYYISDTNTVSTACLADIKVFNAATP